MSFHFEMKRKSYSLQEEKKAKKEKTSELGVADCRSNGLTTVRPRLPRELILRNACDGQS